MCRFYQCFSQEWDEDAVTDAIYLLTNALATPKSDKRDFAIRQYQATIRNKEPRMIGIAEQDFATIQTAQYEEWMDYRAYVANVWRAPQIITVDLLEGCPI